MSQLRVNVGCGRTPTPGWVNLDNSWFVRLARCPLILKLLHSFGFASVENLQTALRAKQERILWADATRRLPIGTNTVSVLYSSHMVEHLDHDEVSLFLKECRRVIAKNGILRIVAPDLRRRVDQYVCDTDADRFMRSLNLESRSLHNMRSKLRMLVVGNREHQWMYDASSLIRLLAKNGFIDVKEVPPGVTGIADPGALDLCEREAESIYVEGRNP